MPVVGKVPSSFSKTAERTALPAGTGPDASTVCSVMPQKLLTYFSVPSLRYRAWPPKREPWAKTTPPAFSSATSTSATIVNERLRMFTADASGTSVRPGR